MYVNIEQYEKKTKGMAVATCIAALIDIVLNYLLIPRYGYWVAAYTTMISYIVLFLIHFILVHRMKLHIVYNTIYVFGIICLMLFIGLLMPKLYEINWLRYCILVIYIGCLIVLLIYNRKEIIKIFQAKADVQ